ncbi:hypothetical protein DLREEDagrD3_11710 [Denitratisoma sp. agr-D3]
MGKISIRNAFITLAISCIVVGFGLAAFNLIKGNWFSAATYVLVGFLAGIYWFPDLIEKTSPPPEWTAGAMVAALLGILSVLNEHPAFDKDRIDGHNQALVAFTNIESYCHPKSPELNALMIEGLKACSLQSYRAMVDAIGQLQKTQTLGPTLSIIDGIHTAATKPNGDWCAETYLVTRNLCPFAFSGMEKRSISVLEKKLD